MSITIETRCRSLLLDLDLISQDERIDVEVLSGGVSSEIACVKTGNLSYCAKFALAKLNVVADWYAPIHRNVTEYHWLDFVSRICPGNTPKLYGQSQSVNGFVMEHISGENVRLWKQDLFQNQVKISDIVSVAISLGSIHTASTHAGFNRQKFQNMSDFHALRLSPYFVAMIEKYPHIREALLQISEELSSNQIALIHGDVSPKNILFRGNTPIFLDAECATMGDPIFDVGFCLNHLVLKALHMPGKGRDLLKSCRVFWRTYSGHIDWEGADDFEKRLCRLLPALLLARVDSKSPVEYLLKDEKERIRETSMPLIQSPVDTLSSYLAHIAEVL